MKNKLFFSIVVGFLLMYGISSFANAKDAPLRRPIDPQNPAFTFWLATWQFYKDANGKFNLGGPERVGDLANAVAETARRFEENGVKQYFIMAILLDRNPTNADVEAYVKICNDNQLYCFIQNQWMNIKPLLDASFKESLFQKYPYFLGFQHPEVTMPIHESEVLSEFNLAVKHGGYLLYQTQGRRFDYAAFSQDNPNLMKALKTNGKNFVMMNRTNDNGQRVVNTAGIIGLWGSGRVGAWGVNGQTYTWYHSGFGEVFGEKSLIMNHYGSKAYWMYPNALIGQEWAQAASMGATMFDLEHSYLVYTSVDGKGLSPTFKYVLLPLMKKMIGPNTIIPSKQEVMTSTKMGYLPSDKTDSMQFKENLIVNIYGKKFGEDSRLLWMANYNEWLMSSGRYKTIPLIPVGATDLEKSNFSNIVTTATKTTLWPNEQAKVKWFNELYPKTSSGSAFVSTYDHKWFATNIYENDDMSNDFEFKLNNTTNTATSLAGVLPPYTFAVIEEKPSEIVVHLNDYVFNIKKYLQEGRFDGVGDISLEMNNFFNHFYCSPLNDPKYDPITKTWSTFTDTIEEFGKRESIIKIKGVNGSVPTISSITGGHAPFLRNFTYTASFDNEKNEYVVKVSHCGAVDIRIDTNGMTSENYSNIAITANGSSGSAASVNQMADFAIDGNDISTRWESNDGANSYIELDFKANKTFNKIELSEYLDRITGYNLQYLSNDTWVDIATDTTIGNAKAHTFNAITAPKVRLLITSVKTDSYNVSNKPSIYEFKVFAHEKGMNPQNIDGTSYIYEAEYDAVVSNPSKIFKFELNEKGYYNMNEGNSSAKFVVKAHAAGHYDLSIAYSRGDWYDATATGMTNLYINGQFVKSIDLKKATSWGGWITHFETVSLNQGKNIIDIKNEYEDYGFMYLDLISLRKTDKTTSYDTTPKPMPQKTALLNQKRHEAENGILMGGATVSNMMNGYSGTGYAQISSVGQAVKMNVIVSKTGGYNVTIRYTYPRGWILAKDPKKSASLYLNNSKTSQITFEKPIENHTSGIMPMVTTPMYLSEGKNEITFKLDTGDVGAIGIDSISIDEDNLVIDEPTAVKLDKTSLTMTFGEETTLKATVEPYFSQKPILLTSSDPRVVTVTGNTIKANGLGTATIKAQAVGTNVSATCTVIVKPSATIKGIFDSFSSATLSKFNWSGNEGIRIAPNGDPNLGNSLVFPGSAYIYSKWELNETYNPLLLTADRFVFDVKIKHLDDSAKIKLDLIDQQSIDKKNTNVFFSLFKTASTVAEKFKVTDFSGARIDGNTDLNVGENYRFTFVVNRTSGANGYPRIESLYINGKKTATNVDITVASPENPPEKFSRFEFFRTDGTNNVMLDDFAIYPYDAVTMGPLSLDTFGNNIFKLTEPKITLGASSDIDFTTLSSSNFTLTDINGHSIAGATVTPTNNFYTGRKIELTIGGKLAVNTDYKVKVTKIKDVFGNTLSEVCIPVKYE